MINSQIIAPQTLPRAIIFDLDGTLVDSWEATRVFFNTIRRGVSLDDMNPTEEEFVFTAAIEQSIGQIIPKDLWPQAHRIWQSIDFNDLLPLTKPQPGIKKLLGWLSRAGVGLGVNTNSGEEALIVLETLDLAGYFSRIITADDVARPKPDPAGALNILRALKAGPSTCVYIGDSRVDQQTAKAAGLAFWAYGDNDLAADWQIESFPRLLALFKNLAGE